MNEQTDITPDDLAEAEAYVYEALGREKVPEVDYSLPVVMREYERRGAELRRLRARLAELEAK